MSTRTISIDVINDVNLRLSNAHAVADLLSECNKEQLCKGTLSAVAYLLMELVRESKDLINGDMEAQS